MLNIKATLLTISSFLLLLSLTARCGDQETKTKTADNSPTAPTYYLENDLHSKFNLEGKVKTVSTLFMDNRLDTIFHNALSYQVYPLSEVSGYRHFHKFDRNGRTQNRIRLYDSTVWATEDFKGLWESVDYSSLDSIPSEIDYKVEYDSNIIYPGMIEPIRASERRIYTKKAFTFNLDSTYLRTYSYKVKDGKILKRMHRNRLGKAGWMDFYGEIVEYSYDSSNRISREDYRYYEVIKDPGVSMSLFRRSHRYHNGIVPGKSTMNKDFFYDDAGNIKAIKMFIDSHYRYEERYFYKDGRLVEKHRIDPNHGISNRAHRTVYHFDERGNILQLDEYDAQDNLGDQLWVDYYDSDDHGNWTRCEMFLSGVHEGEPELTGYRKITYYDE